MNLKEETLEKNTIYTGRIITVRNDTAPVSYTHLTLPTILRV